MCNYDRLSTRNVAVNVVMAVTMVMVVIEDDIRGDGSGRHWYWQVP